MILTMMLGLGYLWCLVPLPLPQDCLSLWLVTLLFILASLTLGLLISTKAQAQSQAMQTMIFGWLPSILLSGFIFHYAAMPTIAQWLELWPDVLATLCLKKKLDSRALILCWRLEMSDWR